MPGTSKKNVRGDSRNKYSVITRVFPGVSKIPTGADFPNRRFLLWCETVACNFLDTSPRERAVRNSASKTQDFPVLGTPTVKAELMPPRVSKYPNNESYNRSYDKSGRCSRVSTKILRESGQLRLVQSSTRSRVGGSIMSAWV